MAAGCLLKALGRLPQHLNGKLNMIQPGRRQRDFAQLSLRFQPAGLPNLIAQGEAQRQHLPGRSILRVLPREEIEQRSAKFQLVLRFHQPRFLRKQK
jgi:hypothetical protein